MNVTLEIDSIRRERGTKLLVLGHHYQRTSVLQHADEIGDSLELSRKSGAHPEADRIVFCGVRFMAESADMLTAPHQTVYMPDTAAGCPMADMADMEMVTGAWDVLCGQSDDWVPVVYVNSSAEIKAFCGSHGGSACTSSNAARVFEWAFGLGKRIFFLPDEHLGVNTALDLGMAREEVVVYDPAREGGGVPSADLARARLVAWKGYCLVHTAFVEQHIKRAREKLPDAQIIVHPEVPADVTRQADAHGSTSRIIKYVENAPAGSTVIVGTEVNLVERLARDHKGRVTVKALSPSVCANMAITNERNLLATLKEWPQRNEIHVPEAIAAEARRSLTTMLEL